MATIRCLSLHAGKKFSATREDVIAQVEQVEKKSFSRHEAFDFHNELKKRNFELVVLMKDAHDLESRPNLAAYLVLAFVKPGNTVVLHKICVREELRRQGIAKMLINTQMERVKGRGLINLQLWVDEGNLAARRLYNCIGFEEVSKVKDYYAVGRVGVQMALSLSE